MTSEAKRNNARRHNDRRSGLVTPLRGALAAAFALTVSMFPGQLRADDGRVCTDAVLKGDYGLVATGTRGAPGGGTETFVTVAMVTYDGNGSFTAIGTSHGSATGSRTSATTGTYHVNRDCTGSETTNIPIPGVPPIEDNFVIVDQGREVRTIVTSPGTISTANLRSK
jgi:hypothetical protein